MFVVAWTGGQFPACGGPLRTAVQSPMGSAFVAVPIGETLAPAQAHGFDRSEDAQLPTFH
jgi:hypothetical protein